MSEQKQRPAEMRNITRERGDVGWPVAIRRTHPKPITYRRTFLDHRHGDAEGALRAAQAWRDGVIERHPPAGYELRASHTGRTNTSGKTGVIRRIQVYKHEDGSIRRIVRWVARTPPGIVPARTKGFSVERYGEQDARRLAIAARERFEAEARVLVTAKGAPKRWLRKSAEMRNISRNADGRAGGWHVRLTRGSTVIARYFGDSRHGGMELAQAAAQAWRDEQERLHPKVSRKERASRLTRSNTSGKTGVLRHHFSSRLEDGSYSTRACWQAKSPSGISPVRYKSFSVEKYGEQEAYRLAVEARIAFEQLLGDS